MKNKIFCFTYIFAFLIICLLPTVMISFFKDSSNSEKRKLSEFPKLQTENGNFNKNWTKEFDTYFSEHFAFRNKLVNLNSSIMNSIFSTSAEDDVIIGKNGWLFYNHTADDFNGISEMQQWEIDDIAKTLQMMSEYAESNGTEMIFTAVPNKNTIYPEYMPYNYIKSDVASNLDRIEAKLSEIDVSFCSLKNILINEKKKNPDKLLYHKTDTHWNNYGAIIAHYALTDMMGESVITKVGEGTISETWKGDLQQMLFPDSKEKDEQIDFSFEPTYTYVGRFKGLSDLTINTTCQDRSSSLLMFRDSFGEAILPFMAENFASAQFSRIVPYSLSQLETGEYDYAVLEIVERNLGNIRKNTPNMPSPVCDSIYEYTACTENAADCNIEKNGSYIKIYGAFEPELVKNISSNIYVKADDRYYEAFPVYEEELLGSSTDAQRGYSLNIMSDSVKEVEIIVETDDGLVSVGKYIFK